METLDKREFEAAWSSSCHRYVIFALLRGNLPRGISAHVPVCRRLARTLVKSCESVGLGCPGSPGACGRFRDAASVGGARRRAPHRPRPHRPALARTGQPRQRHGTGGRQSRTAFPIQNVPIPQTTGVRPQSSAGQRSSRSRSTFPIKARAAQAAPRPAASRHPQTTSPRKGTPPQPPIHDRTAQQRQHPLA